MRPARPSRARAASILPLLVAITLLEPLAGDARSGMEPAPVPPPPASLSDLEKAADAVRSRDFDAARELLEPLTGDGSELAAEATVLLGLYAEACGRPEEARRRLLSARGYGGRFVDWRLLALAESSAALGQAPAAQAALGRLLADHPDSPLRRRAWERAVEVAAERGDRFRALSLIEASRAVELDEETAARFEELAWEVTSELGMRQRQEEAARRLLSRHPLVASRLQVIELFRQPDGSLDWPAILTPPESLERARNLLRAELEKNALEALELVAEADRDLDWRLLRAEALIESRRGLEALRWLDQESASLDRATRSRIDWLRALAAIDASVARRGRTNLPSDERLAMAARAHRQLWALAEEDPDGALARPSLRLLFAETADGQELEESLLILRRLRELDPGDRSGVSHLWELGWKQLEAGDPPAAIGVWSELLELYPESSSRRRVLYWSARAHRQAGNDERAERLLRQVAAVPVNDFYRRHALARLPRLAAEPAPAAAPATLEWPADEALARAALLSDLGLDDAALIEIEALADSVDRAARYALTARVQARAGRRRDSIQALRRAFPDLGTPRQGAVPVDALRLYYPLDFADIVARNASARGLSRHLVMAMIRQESAFDPQATSWAGARGLMQILPTTGRELARRMGLTYSSSRLDDPDFSVRLGTTYIRQVLEMFGDNEELALAGYNAGPYRIRKLWRRAGSTQETDRFVEGLRLAETRTYVKRIVLFADSYRRLYG